MHLLLSVWPVLYPKATYACCTTIFCFADSIEGEMAKPKCSTRIPYWTTKGLEGARSGSQEQFAGCPHRGFCASLSGMPNAQLLKPWDKIELSHYMKGWNDNYTCCLSPFWNLHEGVLALWQRFFYPTGILEAFRGFAVQQNPWEVYAPQPSNALRYHSEPAATVSVLSSRKESRWVGQIRYQNGQSKADLS